MEETQRGGEMRGGRNTELGREWSVWTFLATFPWPLETLDLTSHVIRGCVNQQLGAQMKGCQLLPGAQQATEHSSRVRIPCLERACAHTHTAQFNWAAPDLARKHHCMSQLDNFLSFYRDSDKYSLWKCDNLSWMRPPLTLLLLEKNFIRYCICVFRETDDRGNGRHICSQYIQTESS